MRNDIFPTEPCPNVIDPTPDGARAIPRRDESNRAIREIERRAPDHNSLRAESRVKEGFDLGAEALKFLLYYNYRILVLFYHFLFLYYRIP